MIIKWAVAPSPSEKNPQRHRLLIKGEMRDVFLVVKKFGSLCSRPEKTIGEFNFSIFLARLESDTLEKLKDLALEIEAGPSPAQSAVLPAPVLPEQVQPNPVPVEHTSSSPVITAGNLPGQPDTFEVKKTKIELVTDEPSALTSAVSRSGAEEPEKKSKSDRIITARKPGGVPSQPPQATMRSKPSAGSPDQTAARKKPVEATPQVLSAGNALYFRSRTKWPLELPLDPTHSFQTLVGSHNRFAHAAAMAVVDNPGVMYNPLLIFGAAGIGKTHFINAISTGLAAAIGQQNIFVTDGLKLSKGVEQAVKDGSIGELDAVISGIKVLLIDDIHLLMLTPSNTKYLSKWLNAFMSDNRQLVFTSMFPPKSLTALEAAVGFQFAQGWMVDLKTPPPQGYRVILDQLLHGMDVKLSEEEITSLFVLNNLPLWELRGLLRAMKKLEKFAPAESSVPTHAQLLSMLSGIGEQGQSAALTDADYAESSSWQPSADGAWFKWSVFYPKGLKREAQYALYNLQKRSQELGIRIETQILSMEEYNSDEQYGVSFKIGNVAAEKNANGVIVLGPQPSSALGTQAQEFRMVTGKILSSLLVKSAWLPFDKLKSQAAYTRMLMDLI